MFDLRPFPAYPQSSQAAYTTPLPDNLPPPVAHFFRRIMGDEVPVIYSAVLSGRGSLRFKGITFPARWRFTHCAGQSYHHYIEATVLGWPVMKVNEYCFDGHSRLELPFGVVEHEPKVDMAANLGLWGESIWLPSIFLTDSRVRWEAIDATTARLIVPSGDVEDGFTVSFDAETGLLSRLEAMRYREASDPQKIGWRNDVLAWSDYNGVLLPSRASVTWLDQGIPWFVMSLEEVVYNADVTDYIHAKGA